MSRNYRGRKMIGKRVQVNTLRPATERVIIRDRVMRAIRRKMVNDGILMDRSSRPRKFQFNWTFGELSGTVYSDSKSEARAFIKRDLGISAKKRLPMEVAIERRHNPRYQEALNQEYVNLQACT